MKEKFEEDIEWLLNRYPGATEMQKDIFSEKCGIIQDHLHGDFVHLMTQNDNEAIRMDVLKIMLDNCQL